MRAKMAIWLFSSILLLAACGSAVTPPAGWQVFTLDEAEIWLPERFAAVEWTPKNRSLFAKVLQERGKRYQEAAEWAQKTDLANEVLLVFDVDEVTRGTFSQVTVMRTRVDFYISADEYMQAVLDGYLLQRVLSQEEVELAGRKAVRVETDNRHTDPPLHTLFYCLKKGETVWVLSYVTPADEFERQRAFFEQSAATFSLGN